MKKNLKWLTCAAFCLTIALGACDSKQGKSSDTTAAESSDSTAAVVATETDSYPLAVDRFLIDSIGSQYSPGEYCIPSKTIIAVDETNPDDIRVWGDFWVFNYNLSGDTLKTMSGGSHPGLMHVKQTGETFEVVAFDRVEDGSNYLPTAQKIFGDKFNDFQHISSDEKAREEKRKETIAGYVKKNKVPATMYQDYGWDPITF